MKVEIEFTGYNQKVLLQGKPFFPKIFSKNGERHPQFNVSSLCLDCSMSATLHFEREKKMARELSQRGSLLFWRLRLFQNEILEEMHFLSLEIALEHFLKEIWNEFENVSFGISLFEGKIENLSESQIHDLKLLASRLPDSVGSFLILDSSTLADPFSFFDKTKQGLFGHFHLILKGKWAENFPYAFPFLGWDQSAPLGFFSDQDHDRLPEKKLQRALLLPQDLAGLAPIFFEGRVISETVLTSEWDGVDDLVVFSDKVSEKTRRKLLGFIAAGGRVLTVGEPLNLPNEIPFEKMSIN